MTPGVELLTVRLEIARLKRDWARAAILLFQLRQLQAQQRKARP